MKNNPELQKIIKIFNSSDRYEAHRQVAPLLQKIAADKIFLFETVKYNLSNPDYLKRNRHYPTLSMEIFENENFNMVANLWLPLPDKATNASFQSIHHHGNLILSTISAFGPGYDSIVFKKGFQIDYKTEEVKMEVDKIYHNDLHHLEFIDANTPHIVFYPKDVSVTITLWSSNKSSKKDALKKLGILKSVKKPILNILKKLKIDSLLGLNTVSYFDFYPEGNKIKALQERINFKEGSNDNFIQNVFHVLQKIDFKDDEFIKSLKNNHQINKGSHKWIDKFLHKEEITALFEESHINVPKVHLIKEDILAAVK